MAEEGTNRAIAKNTIILYIRSFVMMAIGIFTSRVILQAVGVENFGLYGVVGSVVSMFTLLNGVLSAGSSRFLTFELGRKDAVRLKQTFAASFAMHCIMAFVLLLLFETVGLWVINNKVTIPEGREFAANVVFQLSVLSCLMSITQVPYGAVIIAREKFNIFAYVGIGEAIFKCVLPLSLLYLDFGDNLIAYAVICTIWSIGLQVFYRIYCYRRFPETRLSICRDKTIYRSMLGYSLWDLLGQFCATGNGQIDNLLINHFFGVRFNASRALAMTVEDKITQFNSQFMTSVVPQITKSYARGDLRRFFELIFEGGRCSFFLLFLITLPIFIEADYIMSIWLVEVPPQMTTFLRILMFSVILRAPSKTIISGIHATGDVKFLNLACGLFVVLNHCPLVFLFYYLGYPAYCCFAVTLVSGLFSTVLEAWALRRKVPYNMLDYFCRVHFRVWLLALLSILPASLPAVFMSRSFLRCALTMLCSLVPTAIIIFRLGISNEMRVKISSKIVSKLRGGKI